MDLNDNENETTSNNEVFGEKSAPNYEYAGTDVDANEKDNKLTDDPQSDSKKIVVGLLLPAYILGIVVFQMYKFGHVLGPIAFTLSLAFFYVLSKSKESVFQQAVNSVIYLTVANLAYIWFSDINLYTFSLNSDNSSNAINIINSMVIAFLFTCPLRLSSSYGNLVIYFTSIGFLIFQYSNSIIFGGLIINLIFITISFLNKSKKFTVTILIYCIISNVIYCILPYIHGKGIDLVFTLTSNFLYNTPYMGVSVQVAQILISLFAGAAISIVAYTSSIRYVKGKNTITKYQINAVSVALSLIIMTTFVWLNFEKCKFNVKVDASTKLYYMPQENSQFLLTIYKTDDLRVLQTKEEWKQVVTKYGIHGWIHDPT